ncbi:hypothetical protein ACVMIH_007487 [Bradyrhizobium sp. USDA 4503]
MHRIPGVAIFLVRQFDLQWLWTTSPLEVCHAVFLCSSPTRHS